MNNINEHVDCTICISDIKECEENRDNCNRNAECDNTIGSFTCTCNDGYTGDGVSCDGMKNYIIKQKLIELINYMYGLICSENITYVGLK